MREIKFRAWDGERMEYDIAVGRHTKDTCQWNTVVVLDDGAVWVPEEQSEFQVMQFTGLHDRNGREIYEGDIVLMLYTDWPSKPAADPRRLEDYLRSISKTGTVLHDPDTGGYEVEYRDGRFGPWRWHLRPGKHGRVEVIGNIHENPELLSDTTT